MIVLLNIPLILFLNINKCNAQSGNWDGNILIPTTTDYQVGIGTSAPDADLHIKKTDNNYCNNNDLFLYQRFELFDNPEEGCATRIWDILLNNNGLLFRNVDNIETDVLFMKNNGYVGIHNNNPKARLDVKGDIIFGKTYNEYSNKYMLYTALPWSDAQTPIKTLRIGPLKDGESLPAISNSLIFYNNNIGIGSYPYDSKTKLTVDGNMIIGKTTGYHKKLGIFEIYEDNNDFWSQYIRNGGGSARLLRIKGGFPNATQALFQVEANNWEEGRDDEEDEIRFRILANGKVLIGKDYTGSDDFLLSVSGTTICNELIVTDNSNWADFVFNDDYELMTLKELEKYIKINKHLPEIPTESFIKQNGYNIGEMDAKLLQKIEELTLYILELKKEIDTLTSENGLINKKLNSNKF
ncbi:MAG: hypothetical protein U9R42_13000 [Bacteroidota bacterium]|nr:hypothetical protein [Bacteroidota bacterium]